MPKAVRRKSPSLPRNVLISLGIPTIFIPGLILAAVLGWDWKQGLAKLKQSGGYLASKEVFPTSATVVSVEDGDTITLSTGQTLRLIGIDAPDRGQPGYQEAKDYLTNLIDGEQITIEYGRYQDDKFGRLLGYVFEVCSNSPGCRNGSRLVNRVLVRNNYAKPVVYNDRARLKYQDQLQSADKQGSK